MLLRAGEEVSDGLELSPPARRVQEAEAARLGAGRGQIVGSIPVLQEAVENGRAAGAGGDEE